MVNCDPLRLIQYGFPPSPLPRARRDLKLPGPRYNLDLIKPLAAPENIRLLTAKCERDVGLLRWTIAEVSELLAALESHHYRDSEWCGTGKGMAVDCDAYVIRFDVDAVAPDPAGRPIYVKFGLRPNHRILLTVSCHEGFDEI